MSELKIKTVAIGERSLLRSFWSPLERIEVYSV